MRSKTLHGKGIKRMGHVMDADQAFAFKSKVGKLSGRIWVDYILSERGGPILGNKAVTLASCQRSESDLYQSMGL